jgi:hypothetical protein
MVVCAIISVMGAILSQVFITSTSKKSAFDVESAPAQDRDDDTDSIVQ